jgi:cytochrome P450
MAEPFEFDPFDPRFFENPYPAYAVMRREHPVYRREIEQPRVFPHYWMVTRAADVNDAFADWKTFSSAKGPIVDTDASLIPPNLFNMDPPRHDELRAILARAITAPRTAGLEPHVREFARELVDGWKGDGVVDVATQYAQMIPTITMCALLDLPRADRPKFLRWNLDSHGDDFTSEAALRAYAEMDAYWTDLVEERRRERTDDLISAILHADVKGAALSNEEISRTRR